MVYNHQSVLVDHFCGSSLYELTCNGWAMAELRCFAAPLHPTFLPPVNWSPTGKTTPFSPLNMAICWHTHHFFHIFFKLTTHHFCFPILKKYSSSTQMFSNNILHPEKNCPDRNSPSQMVHQHLQTFTLAWGTSAFKTSNNCAGVESCWAPPLNNLAFFHQDVCICHEKELLQISCSTWIWYLDKEWKHLIFHRHFHMENWLAGWAETSLDNN